MLENSNTTGIMKALLRIASAAAFMLAPSLVKAQVGSTTDIIMGRVTTPEGTPLAGARVAVTSTETQITRNKTTDAEGRYSILFPDGGGSYTVQVTSIGYAPQRFALARVSDEDRLVRDVTMGRNATVLQSVQVRANNNRGNQQQRPEPGSTERALNPNLINRLPVEAGDLNALATLAPGVVGIAGTDSTAASFSVGGQPADQNNITLDGLTFGAGSVPQEAVRSTRVITSTYDVARGQFTGGQVASTTRGGTNVFQGAVNYSLRDPDLEFVEDPDNAFSSRYTQNQVSGGFGGPIIKDKLFAFGAASFSRRTDPLQSLLAADPLALQRLGTNGDSVTRFINLLQQFGLQPTSAQIPEERLNNTGSALIRIDYNLAEAHTLMIRGDWRGSIQDASRISPFAVPHSGGNAKSSGGGGMVTLTSHLGSMINEVRAYRSLDSRSTDPYVDVPSGRVIVASNLPDGSLGVSTLQFGVNPGLPQQSKSWLTEFSDELSRVSKNGAHRVKLGLLVNQDRSDNGSFNNALGTYTFNSLADFENGTAASFSRTLSRRNRTAGSMNGALYLGDAWRKSPKLQLTYGARLETSRYPDAPAFNAALDSVFGGVRTDRFPSEVHLSPRVGFTYNFSAARNGPPVGSLRGGIGEFRGRASSGLFSSAATANGLTNGQSQIVCVGPTVPAPDWQLFNDDPATVPSTCNGTSQQFGNERRNITVFSPDFVAPRAWRGSLGFNRRFRERFNFSVDASFARGVAQTGARDLNLDVTPKFTLESEGGRPVYAPTTSIVPTTGAISLTGSRVASRFGVVSQINSDLESNTRQLTASLSGITTKALVFNFSYTFTRSTDQTQGISSFGGGGGFGGSGGSTAGNPNVAERATSDNERRHSILGTVTWPIKPAFELTAITRLTSGGYFTPIVGGDINGDGLRNDRPFIFDPVSAGDTALANGMSRLMSSAPQRARECLEKQMGTIASRNSCSVPWRPSFDLQANIRPNVFGLNRKLTISVVGLNTLAGIDQLLHGNDNLHGWGQPVFPDRTLMYVRGFDRETRRFEYQVNEHFGAAAGSRNAFRVPFQLALQMRLALGQDPARQQFNNVFGGRGGNRASAADFRERLARAVPNPFKRVLELNDSLQLALTDTQKAKLTVMGDSLQVKADTLVGSLAQTLGSNEARTADPLQLGMKMRGRIQEGRALSEKALKDLQTILTPEQWAKVPDDIKQPFQRREGQGRTGPPGG
jgi:hypothetical protein